LIHQQVAIAAWNVIAQGEPAPPMAGAPNSGAGTQGSPNGTGGGGGGSQAAPFDNMVLIFGMLAIFMVVMMITTGRRQKKERKQREEMLSGLRRNDRVQTSGGMLGKIVEVKGDEVLLKVDESNNTRIRFSKSAIQQVIKQGAGEPAQEVEGA